MARNRRALIKRGGWVQRQEQEDALREMEGDIPADPVENEDSGPAPAPIAPAPIAPEPAPQLQEEQRALLEEKRKQALLRLEARKKALAQVDDTNLEIV